MQYFGRNHTQLRHVDGLEILEIFASQVLPAIVEAGHNSRVLGGVVRLGDTKSCKQPRQR